MVKIQLSKVSSITRGLCITGSLPYVIDASITLELLPSLSKHKLKSEPCVYEKV